MWLVAPLHACGPSLQSTTSLLTNYICFAGPLTYFNLLVAHGHTYIHTNTHNIYTWFIVNSYWIGMG